MSKQNLASWSHRTLSLKIKRKIKKLRKTDKYFFFYLKWTQSTFPHMESLLVYGSLLDSCSQSLKFLDCNRPTALQEWSPEQIQCSVFRHRPDFVTKLVLCQPRGLRAGRWHTPALQLWDTHEVLASPVVVLFPLEWRQQPPWESSRRMNSYGPLWHPEHIRSAH